MPQVNIHVDELVKELLRRHAFERDVSTSALVRDILLLWLHSVTDMSNPIFNPVILETGMPPRPYERKPGYLRSLAFVLDEESTDVPLPAPSHTDPIPETEEEVTFLEQLDGE